MYRIRGAGYLVFLTIRKCKNSPIRVFCSVLEHAMKNESDPMIR